MEYQHNIFFLWESQWFYYSHGKIHQKNPTLIQHNFVDFSINSPIECWQMFGVYCNAQIKTLKWYDHKGYELSSQQANGQDAKYQPRIRKYF